MAKLNDDLNFFFEIKTKTAIFLRRGQPKQSQCPHVIHDIIRYFIGLAHFSFQRNQPFFNKAADGVDKL